jgi:hypothetical protein
VSEAGARLKQLTSLVSIRSRSAERDGTVRHPNFVTQLHHFFDQGFELLREELS